MGTKTQTRYSLRARWTLYLAGMAAMALPWGFLLFILPWLRARAAHLMVCSDPPTNRMPDDGIAAGN